MQPITDIPSSDITFKKVAPVVVTALAIGVGFVAYRIWSQNSVSPITTNRLLGSVLPSNNPQDIGWKILKYEKQIEDLSHFSEELSRCFKDVLIKDRDRFNKNYLEHLRESYKDFLLKLRDGLLTEPYNDQLLKMCSGLFLGIDLREVALSTLKKFEGLQLKTNFFTDRLYHLYECIQSAPYAAKSPVTNQLGSSARGHFNVNFDPFSQGNPVHVLYRIKIGKKEVAAIGMGTPTQEDWPSHAELNPEFLGFIRFYKQQGKKHLYVNNQNPAHKNMLNGDETNRCNLILSAQDHEELKGALYAISLSKNSPFYYQSHDFRDQSDASLFKVQLNAQLLEKERTESGCYLPESLRKEIPFFNLKVKTIIETVHETLFDQKLELAESERRLFIELVYDQIIKLILLELGVDSFNISCKDAIDRGAGSNAQLYTHCALVLGELTSFHKEVIETLMLARALFVRKRQPVKERLDRFVESYHFYTENQNKLKRLHLILFENQVFEPS